MIADNVKNIVLSIAKKIFHEYFIGQADENMETWKRHFKKGKDNLSKHNPKTALRELHLALAQCPAKENSSLAKVMFYIGITLKKLGAPNGAVKSWVVAQKLNKSGYSSKMIKRFVNDYGMTKQNNDYEDDWKAFHAIQLSKYLDLKEGGTIPTSAERDVITDLIWDKWNAVNTDHTLYGLTTDEKIEYFQSVEIFFPVHREQQSYTHSRCIHVNFAQQERISWKDRCFCGSGLPYGKCCGRTPGEDELCNGSY
jgi:hypothetical protein